ncbi:hypothetical protein Syun_006835 [Stephania yunnanensis]|uniref:Chromosome transmission fidelity protein 18 homolog n=1 Tax=Stephania yunnanensis TaxID=152371 RepID=A0AAP0PZQ0_9MAGN
MDMDDIPEADELEWLENNALPPEDDDGEEDMEQYFYPPDPEEVQLQQQQQQPSNESSILLGDHSVASKKQIESKKRPCPESALSGETASEEKRNRLSSSPSRGETDEDWLSYSPQRDVEAVRVEVAEEKKCISRFAMEIEGDCVPVTGPCGNRVYAKISGGEWDSVRRNLRVKARGNGLMSESIDTLMQKIERETLTKALKASSESNSGSTHLENVPVCEQLWVEKYAPKSFTELLSDEQTNREVLLWLKQWDSCVFRSEIRSTTDDVLSSLRRHSSVSQHQKLSNKSFFSTGRKIPFAGGGFKPSDNLEQEANNLKSIPDLLNKKSRGAGPPDHKILLLCGPPGLGKTTLAHVAAKHCGYHVVEINASDDRSSSTVEAKILDVVQMNSVMVDSKPKCLVIDEIDGALGDGKGAVEVIMKMVAAEKKLGVRKTSSSQDEQPGKVKSKRHHKDATLSRPVICICNDLYAPALRPLRQVAKVHTFMQPTVSRVVSRLKYICNKEGFRASSIALTALAEYTECDIRSCLNTLQFLNKKREAINVLEISSQVVGQKDISRSVLDVWKEVFQMKKMRRKQKVMIRNSSLSGDFDAMYSVISNCGDYELIIEGIHENILHLHYHDPLMQKTVNCLNVLGISEYLHQYILRTQQQILTGYQPYAAIAVHSLVAHVGRPNIEWPRSLQRFRTMYLEKKAILKCWNNRISPLISRHLSPISFVEDFASPLIHILSPQKLRPVIVKSLSEGEKHDLFQLVETMSSYSISYKSTRSGTLPMTPKYEAALDESTLVLDPPIDEFIKFKGHISEHSQLSLAMKQVLLHEVERQKICLEYIDGPASSHDRKREECETMLGTDVEKALSRIDAKAASSKKVEVVTNKLNPTKRTGNVSTSSSDSNGSKTVGVKENNTVVSKKHAGGFSCFFDRFRKPCGKGSLDSDSTLQKAATLERDSRPLLFKFNELSLAKHRLRDKSHPVRHQLIS